MKKISSHTLLALLVLLAIILLAGCGGILSSGAIVGSNSGGLVMTVTPENTEVYVDGVLMGKASDFKGKNNPLVIKTGKHTIKLIAEGYYSYDQMKTIPAGIVSDFTATLGKKE